MNRPAFLRKAQKPCEAIQRVRVLGPAPLAMQSVGSSFRPRAIRRRLAAGGAPRYNRRVGWYGEASTGWRSDVNRFRRSTMVCVLLVGAGLGGAPWAGAAPARSAGPDAARIAEITAMLPDAPCGPGPRIADRAAWGAAAKAPAFRDVIPQAEKLLRQPIPETTDELYLDYWRTGNRDRYQRVLFAKMNRLATLVLAECLEDRGRFLEAIDATVRATLEQKSWVLPAHDGSLAVFKGQVMEIDLAAAATGANLATLDWWLGEKLPSETRKGVARELERRIFQPFEGMVLRGKPRQYWLAVTNNWNAVCLAGVTVAATTSIAERQRRALFVAAAEKYIQNFLDGFTPDGYCSEGLGYWNYGFGHFVLLAENVFQATGGKIDLFERPKVRQIAQFGHRLEIVPGVYPAFADCHVEARPDMPTEAFVSRRFGFGWKDVEQRGLLLASGPRRDLFAVGLLAFPNSASRRPPAQAAEKPEPRTWFADAGVLICRPAGDPQRCLGAALKGGHNAEHHNHNDVGSFVVALANHTPLLDPGAEVYTRRTFSGRRYESQVLNSFGHPVPRVAGQLQATGRQAAACVLKAEFTDQCDTLVLDLRSAYPVKELHKLQRTFVFSRQGRGSLSITDEVLLASPAAFETALVTFDPWKQLGPGRLMIGTGPSAVQVDIDAQGKKFEVRAEEIHEDLPGKRVPVRIGIALAEPVTEAVVRLTIVPAGK